MRYLIVAALLVSGCATPSLKRVVYVGTADTDTPLVVCAQLKPGEYTCAEFHEVIQEMQKRSSSDAGVHPVAAHD